MQFHVRMAKGAAAALGLVLLTGGCVAIRDHRGFLVDQALVDSIQPGTDNRTSVERTLGRPTFISQFGNKSYFYVATDTRQSWFQRPKSEKQVVLRINFDPAGNVATIDRTGMEKVARIDPDGHKTPTLGKDRSFLEDLFGNIGAVGAPGMGGGATGGGGTGPNGS